jgi:WD40 repeat protein
MKTSPGPGRIPWFLWGGGAAVVGIYLLILVAVVLSQNKKPPDEIVLRKEPPVKEEVKKPANEEKVEPVRTEPPRQQESEKAPAPKPPEKVTPEPAKKESAEEVAALEGHTDSVQAVIFTHDSRQIVSGGRDGTIRFWTVASPKEVKRWDAWGAVHALVLSSDDKRLLTSQSLLDKWKLYRFDVPTGRSAEYPENIFLFIGDSINDVTAAPDAPWLVLAGLGSETFVLVDEKPKSVTSGGHGKAVDSVALAPGGKVAATAGSNGIRLWKRAASLEAWHHLKSHTGKIIRLAFSKDGATLASAGASDEGKVRLWEVKTGKEARVISVSVKESSLKCATFSADLRQALCGYDDGSLRSWNLKSGALLWSVTRAHDGPILSVAFSSDGRHAASGGQDKTVRLWRLPGP